MLVRFRIVGREVLLLILAKYLSFSLLSLSLSFEEVDDEEELGGDEKEMLAYLQQ